MADPATCEVRGPEYDDVTFSRACPFHGDTGSMVVAFPPRAKVEPVWKVKGTVNIEDLNRRAAEALHGGQLACPFCNGDGDACNPENGDPARRVIDWLPPVLCPRCGGTGKEPNHG